MKCVLSKTASNTRQNIIDGFFKLYQKQRIEKITVSKLCEVSGYNRSTFYEYFDDIYAVLDAMEEQVLPEKEFKEIVFMNIMMLHKTKASEDNIEQSVMRQVLTFFEEKEVYFKILLGERGDIAFRKKLLRRLSPVIFEIMNYKVEDASVRAEFIMEYQSAAVLAMITKWYEKDKCMEKEELINLIIKVTTNGVKEEMLRYATENPAWEKTE